MLITSLLYVLSSLFTIFSNGTLTASLDCDFISLPSDGDLGRITEHHSDGVGESDVYMADWDWDYAMHFDMHLDPKVLQEEAERRMKEDAQRRADEKFWK